MGDSEVQRRGARAEILGRIRAAINPSSTVDAGAIEQQWLGVRREYIRAGTLSIEDCIALFTERVRDYDAGVSRCARADASAQIAEVLARRGKTRMVVAEGFPGEWMPSEIDFMKDRRIDNASLLAADGVLTTATVAIALTGSIILQDAPGQGRRALSLLPDYHLCVVEVSALVETVPEALVRLAATASKATTFFSGPSATADIEMTRIKGVHGPRFVDVVLVHN